MTLPTKSPEPTMGDRTATFAARGARFLLRLLFVLMVGLGLGLAVYFGVPAVYRKYVEPVQANTERLAEVEAALAASRNRAAATGRRSTPGWRRSRASSPVRRRRWPACSRKS